MGRVQLWYKVLKNYLLGNVVTPTDIGNSYDLVSSSYNDRFLNIMHKYNIVMLSQISLPEQAKVLDLACGTGFNSEYLLGLRPNYTIDGVDISEGMLKEAALRLRGKVNLYQDSMLSFLKNCKDEEYHMIICSWALKYQPPLEVLKECNRALKPGGQIAVILNSRHTLPEIRRIYKHLLIRNSKGIKKLMLELPNPKNEKHLKKWFIKAGFEEIYTFGGAEKFRFDSTEDMTQWVTSTGALAGFDIMVDLHDRNIKEQVSNLFRQFGIMTVTHDFVWGRAKKCE
ncbi:MAG: class I SAM-dependent methyltransferase [Clostridia bacterium]|nr:class I SAM-dependent methyltransferase [Clostridia bacterium]